MIPITNNIYCRVCKYILFHIDEYDDPDDAICWTCLFAENIKPFSMKNYLYKVKING